VHSPNKDLPADARRASVSGWVEAFLFVLAIGFLGFAYVVGHQVGAHPIAFILYAMTVSALVILASTGLGPDARAIVLAPQSWLIGFGTIGMELFYYWLLRYVPPADGSLLARLMIPAAVLTGWMLFARRPSHLTLIGAAIVCLGVAPVLAFIDAAHVAPVVIATIGCALAFNLRTFAGEFHPWNRNARTVMEKLRITGLVVLVTALTSLGLAALGALSTSLGMLPSLALIPTGREMLHLPTILLGALVGSVIHSAMAFLSLSAVVKITSENFAAATVLTPIATLVVQWIAGKLGLIPLFLIDAKLLVAMAIVIGGVLLMLRGSRLA
jgi:drug/metabolite transporter (DMT)-like permease